MNDRVSFVGGGNMAYAMIGGMLRQGFRAADICAVEIAAEAREKLATDWCVETYGEVATAVPGSTVVVLAVKPQQLRGVARQLQPLLTGQLVVSIAAGIRTMDLSRWLGAYNNIVRVMPNTPALVGAGIAALYAMPGVSAAGRDCSQRLLEAVGNTLWFSDETALDAVTALSGSGPAYVFYFLEALEQAGTELGLPSLVARRLALETLLGAGKLANQGSATPAELRERVTSKGGTTEAALRRFADHGLKQSIIDAVRAAHIRSREMGEQLGEQD
jgi:pyrroline-5-carboxylate reductase